MTNISVIENKMSTVQKYLAILSRYSHVSLEELKTDVTVRGAVERYLYLVSQATIDLSEAVIAFKNLRKPSSYSECFDILFEAGLIPPSLRDQLIKMTGFRNVLAHDYTAVRVHILHEVLTKRLKDVDAFEKTIKEALSL